MTMKIKCITTVICLFLSFSSKAQVSVTYYHDAAKQNQFTVQEIGVGGLTPSFYYDVFHRNYQKTAASKNKLSYRTLAGVSAYQQIEDADSVELSLKKRAEIEALNVADRTGGALDIAWLAEGNKINSKLSDFQNNINRIISSGGTFSEKERWTEYYNIFQCAIKATQDAYMPNSQRKKQYLSIYADITKQNEVLIAYLVQLNKREKVAELLSASYTRTSNKRGFATAAYNRWRNASWGSQGRQIDSD